LTRQGVFGIELGRYEAATDLLRPSLELARRLALPREEALCLNVLTDIGLAQGAHLEAEQHYQASLTISQEIGDPLAQAALLEIGGWKAQERGNYDQAYRLWQQSLQFYRAIEQPFGLARLCNMVALAAYDMGRYEEAEQFWIGNCSASPRQGLKPQAKSPKPTQVGWISVRFSVLELLALSFSSGRTARLSSYTSISKGVD
jgi:tetratricopeptide (TPR) repeat protein